MSDMSSVRQRKRVVVGDIHGELEGLTEILENAGLIDDGGAWTGEDAILIQTGDVVDRGPSSREALHFLGRLQKEAAIAGGEVVRLCGNHELMLLQGYYGYASYEHPGSLASELKEEIAKGNVLASFTDGTRLYTHAGLRSAVRETIVGDIKKGHSGLGPETSGLLLLSDRINAIFRKAVRGGFKEQHPIFYVGRDRGGRDPVGGIFWCDFSSITPSEEAYIIPQVFGHTPTGKAGVETARGLSLIDVDAGMCRFYGGKRVYLEITPDGRLLEHGRKLDKWAGRALDEAVCPVCGWKLEDAPSGTWCVNPDCAVLDDADNYK